MTEPRSICRSCSRTFAYEYGRADCQPCRYRRTGLDWLRRQRQRLRRIARRYGQEYSR